MNIFHNIRFEKNNLTFQNDRINVSSVVRCNISFDRILNLFLSIERQPITHAL